MYTIKNEHNQNIIIGNETFVVNSIYDAVSMSAVTSVQKTSELVSYILQDLIKVYNDGVLMSKGDGASIINQTSFLYQNAPVFNNKLISEYKTFNGFL